MDSLVVGTGWYEVEKEGDEYFRWIGPEPEATIHLYMDRGTEHRLNLVCHRVLDAEIVNGLVLEVDRLSLCAVTGGDNSPLVITSVIPRDESKPRDEPSVLTIKLPHARPIGEGVPGSSDERVSGLSLRALHIFPLERPLFVSEKYSDPSPFDGLDYMEKNRGVKDLVLHKIYDSAYQHYLKEGRGTYTARLHARFDERPGDIVDILRMESQQKVQVLRAEMRREISLMREILARHGDAVRGIGGHIEAPAKKKP